MNLILQQLLLALLLFLVGVVSAEDRSAETTLDEYAADFADEEDDEGPISFSGFVDARFGNRVRTAIDNDNFTLGEIRARIDLQGDFDFATVKVVSDVVFDPIEHPDTVDLYQGNGLFDLRELSVAKSLGSIDLKIGRQVITWGTGDMLFIHDMFPKDWKSFFIGRNDEYLKVAQDAVKASYFNPYFTVDFVWTPLFASDRYVDGNRISYFSGMSNSVVGESTEFDAEKRDTYGDDSEFSMRVSQTWGGTTVALYGYKGFWKSPNAMRFDGTIYYPELWVYGGSVQSPLFGGLVNAEYGHYYSKEDVAGLNPMIPNSELRFLGGYEHELAKNLMGSMQYYVEYMLEHDAYRKNLMPGMIQKVEYRDLIAIRLTKMMMNQTLILSLFSYYSTAENDAYTRGNIALAVTDYLTIDAGVNVFAGEHNDTFFGQFESNSNVYGGIKVRF